MANLLSFTPGADSASDNSVEVVRGSSTEGEVSIFVRATDLLARRLAFVYATTNPTSAWSTAVGMNTDGTVFGYMWDGEAQLITGATQFQAGEWVRITLSWKDGEFLKLYANGVLEASQNITVSYSAGTRWWLGRRAGSTGIQAHEGWKGELSYFTYRTVQRSDAEVAADWNTLPDAADASLSVLLPMDEGSGATCFDAVVADGSHSGTITGATWTTGIGPSFEDAVGVVGAWADYGIADAELSITPTGIEEGDLLYFIAQTRNCYPDANGPEGNASWEKILERDVNSGTVDETLDVNERLVVWKKTAGASEPASYTLAITGDGDDGAVCHLIALRNAEHSLIDVAAGNTAPSLEGASGGALLAFFGFSYDPSASYTGPPTGMVLATQEAAHSADYPTALSAYQILDADGATGTKTVQQTNVNQWNVAVSISAAVFVEPPPPPAGQVEIVRRAWMFPLHGHIFYVLDVDDKMLVYDFASGQWCRWKTSGHDRWNMHRGVVWRGRILAADVSLAKIWELDPQTELDEDALQIERVVTGFMPVRGDGSYRQGAMRLTASVGSPVASPATVQLRFSDDGGRTWVGPFSVTLVAGNFSQEIAFRSLGRLQDPGRLWEITDTGGLVRIDGADSEIDEV